MKVIDMHCDTIGGMFIERQKGRPEQHIAKNDMNIDLEKMRQGDYMAQCFAMFVPYSVENPFETCMGMIDRFYEEMDAHQDVIGIAKNYDDLVKNQKEGKMSAILTIEEGGVTKGNLAYLRDFYRLGVRMITLNWNFVNGVGHPNFTMPEDKSQKPDFKTPNTKDGLTPYGIEMVKEMNRLGIIIDVSHLSDAGFYDVLKYTTGPFVASHSNARAVCPHVRNLTDDMIRELAKRGGVTGINYCADFLREAKEGEKNFSYIADMVKHIQHIVEVGGIDCVGLGSDFDGIEQNLEMKDASYLPQLAQALKDAGFSEEDIEKIFYKNVLRVFKEVTK